MSDKYILDGKIAVPCDDLITWGKWLEKADRVVAKSDVKTDEGLVRVSTVFLGLDHSFESGIPLLFETMAFGGKLDGEMERCTTWEQAEEQHAEMCKRVENACNSLEKE